MLWRETWPEKEAAVASPRRGVRGGGDRAAAAEGTRRGFRHSQWLTLPGPGDLVPLWPKETGVPTPTRARGTGGHSLGNSGEEACWRGPRVPQLRQPHPQGPQGAGAVGHELGEATLGPVLGDLGQVAGGVGPGIRDSRGGSVRSPRGREAGAQQDSREPAVHKENPP